MFLQIVGKGLGGGGREPGAGVAGGPTPEAGQGQVTGGPADPTRGGERAACMERVQQSKSRTQPFMGQQGGQYAGAEVGR